MKSDKNSEKLLGIAILLGLIIVIGGLIWVSVIKDKDTDPIPLVIPKDTAVQHIGDTARTQAITASNPNDLLAIKSKDSTILVLQGLVKQYKKELLTAMTVTQNIKVSTVVKTDSIQVDSINVYPTYITDINNKWYTAKVTSNSDSTHLDFDFVNQYDAVIAVKKNKWYVDVINHNPYTTTNYIRALHVVPPRLKNKQWAIGIQGGYGAILSDNKVVTRPYVGVGISYNLIRF